MKKNDAADSGKTEVQAPKANPTQLIEIALIDPSPFQARREFPAAEIAELTEARDLAEFAFLEEFYRLTNKGRAHAK
jgi:hypothetical protein